LARIRENGRYGFADKSGKLVIPARYEYAESFSDGFAVVGEDQHFWYIDSRGNRASFGIFAAASPFFKGLANVQLISQDETKPDRFAYIDTNGRRIFAY
jgi:hypothetical protein